MLVEATITLSAKERNRLRVIQATRDCRAACTRYCTVRPRRHLDGKRYLLLHGDEFDTVTRYHRWLAALGDRAYSFVVRLNIALSWIRRTLGVSGYWSLSGYAKRKVKSAVSFIYDFEESVVRNVQDRDLDGVICGHIHAATIRDIEGITYINCGDWVDSCTAILEHGDGRMELVHWGAANRTADLQSDLAFGAPEASPKPRIAA
jgi:UDP-2,3-diacylglucosamine pyrophosphatase LpxH